LLVYVNVTQSENRHRTLLDITVQNDCYTAHRDENPSWLSRRYCVYNFYSSDVGICRISWQWKRILSPKTIPYIPRQNLLIYPRQLALRSSGFNHLV